MRHAETDPKKDVPCHKPRGCRTPTIQSWPVSSNSNSELLRTTLPQAIKLFVLSSKCLGAECCGSQCARAELENHKPKHPQPSRMQQPQARVLRSPGVELSDHGNALAFFAMEPLVNHSIDCIILRFDHAFRT